MTNLCDELITSSQFLQFGSNAEEDNFADIIVIQQYYLFVIEVITTMS